MYNAPHPSKPGWATQRCKISVVDIALALFTPYATGDLRRFGGLKKRPQRKRSQLVSKLLKRKREYYAAFTFLTALGWGLATGFFAL